MAPALSPQMYAAARTWVRRAQSLLQGSTNLVIILGMMQVSKRVPFDDPLVLTVVRGIYVLSNLLIAGIYLYIQSKVNGPKKGEPDHPTRPCYSAAPSSC